MTARLATPEEFALLTALVDDTPDNAIIWHLMRRDGAAAWFAGDVAAPVAVAFDYGGDLHGIGTAAGLTQVSLADDAWHSISVAPAIADELEHRLRDRSPNLRRLEDLHWVLTGPARPREPHPSVRSCDENDVDAIDASGLWREDHNISDAVRRGYVACAFFGSAVVGGAASTAWSPRHADVGVQVLGPHRRQGIAVSAAALVSGRLQRGGRTPVWSTVSDNHASIATAAALGFTPTTGRVILTRYEG